MPKAGDIWKRDGHTDIEVTKVAETQVTFRQGSWEFTVSADKFDALAAESLRLGATAQSEPECMFE